MRLSVISFSFCVALLVCNIPAACGAETADAEYREAMLEGARYARAENTLSQAISHFKEAIRLQPRSAEAHYRLALAYCDIGRYMSAMDMAEKATLLDENHAGAWLVLGTARFYSDLEAEAITALNRSLRLDPRNPHTVFILGRCYYYMGRSAEDKRNNKSKALHYFKQTIKLDSMYVSAHFMEGCCFLDLDMTEAATDSFLRALRLDPGYDETYFRLALCAVKSGKYVEGERNLNECIRLNPDHYRAHLLLADLYADKLADRRLAVVHYQDFLEKAPKDHPDIARVKRMLGQK